MTEIIEMKWICGFWRRIGAFLLDSVVLGIVGLGMGFFLEKFFVEIGAWGILIGFSIALIYFGIMNSGLANGQTLGKKALEIRVVDGKNKPISFIKSIGRYSVIGIPYFLNGAQFPVEATSTVWHEIFSFVCFCVYLSVVYLYVFNRNTRQSLHDLIFGTYVVNAQAEKASVGSISRPHLVAVSLFFTVTVIVSVLALHLAQQGALSDINKSQQFSMINPSVKYAAVSFGENIVSTFRTGTTETSFASAEVLLKDNHIENTVLAHEVAEYIANAYPQALEKDVILINLVYGYDIGIASKWYRHSHTINPNELVSDQKVKSKENVN